MSVERVFGGAVGGGVKLNEHLGCTGHDAGQVVFEPISTILEQDWICLGWTIIEYQVVPIARALIPGLQLHIFVSSHVLLAFNQPFFMSLNELDFVFVFVFKLILTCIFIFAVFLFLGTFFRLFLRFRFFWLFLASRFISFIFALVSVFVLRFLLGCCFVSLC
uniref:Uncharacterized protein n=1 Tax=Cacopsylla melanoneura TaxID=428564 RepID=A0A8D8VFT9_9HEMI